MPTQFQFDEVLFDPGIFTEGMTGGPEFDTSIVTTPAGISQANVNRYDSISKYDVPLTLLSQTKLRKALTFFRARRGMARPFRFRPLEDHGVTLEAFATGTGTSAPYQLQVTYLSGGEQDVRKIVKPVVQQSREKNGVQLLGGDGLPRNITNPIKIYINGIEQTGASWKVDAYTGVLTFTSSFPSLGTIVSWTGDFDIPARFGTDRWPGRYDLGGVSEATLPIWEVLPPEIGL